MAEVVATTVGEFVAEASTGSSRTLPRGCDLAPFAPHGVYRTADERWLALSVQSDDEWRRVLKSFGAPTSLLIDGWAAADARYAARHEIDDALQRLIGMRPLDEVVDALTADDVRAAPVLDGAQLVEDEHLEERGFFPRIEHPDLDDARIVGLGWRFAGDGPIPLRPPPVLGSTALDDVTRREGG
jgi:crotonobetainyl-CoA:carnitine CoA-transferase CaiB-like acyl-CoA transferase